MNAAPADIEKLSSAIESCDGKSAEMAATMQDNLAGQLTILKSQLQELAILPHRALSPPPILEMPPTSVGIKVMMLPTAEMIFPIKISTGPMAAASRPIVTPQPMRMGA